MDNFNLKKFLTEGRLHEEVSYNFEGDNPPNEPSMVEDILNYFKYERDERPEDMGEPDWWKGNPPFDGMSDDEIKDVIMQIISHKDFQDPNIQSNFDAPSDLAWEIHNSN